MKGLFWQNVNKRRFTKKVPSIEDAGRKLVSKCCGCEVDILLQEKLGVKLWKRKMKSGRRS